LIGEVSVKLRRNVQTRTDVKGRSDHRHGINARARKEKGYTEWPGFMGQNITEGRAKGVLMSENSTRMKGG